MTKKTSELLTDDGDAGAAALAVVFVIALLDAAPDLVAALEPLRQTAELVATDVRATT